MPLIQRFPQAASSTTLFGGVASQTNVPSQGSVSFYQDGSCSSPLSDTPTPLILGQCQNVPIPDGIVAVSIASVPTCNDYGTPILVVSNQPDCKNSTAGTDADSGELGKCQAYSTGADIGSIEFICYGSGIAPAAPTTTISDASPVAGPTSAAATADNEPDDDNGSGDGDGSDDTCCCCCTVM